MRRLLNTLYVTTPEARLTKDGENLVAEVEGEERVRVPFHMLGSVVVFGQHLYISTSDPGMCCRWHRLSTPESIRPIPSPSRRTSLRQRTACVVHSIEPATRQKMSSAAFSSARSPTREASCKEHSVTTATSLSLIAILNHLRAKVYWPNLGNWKYFFCRIPLTNRFLICSKQVVHIAWVRTKVLPFNQMSSTGFSCGV